MALKTLGACVLCSIAVAQGFAAAGSYNLSIPAESLGDALSDFAQQSGLQVLFSSQLVNGIYSAPVKGSLSAEQALRALLANTKLRFEFVNPHTITILSAAGVTTEPVSPPSGAPPVQSIDRSPVNVSQTGDRAVPQRSLLSRLLGVFVFCSAGHAGIGCAQDATGAQPADEALQEVVITAQRRSENLQTVPIAATAIGGDQLESKAVVRLEDLQNISPGLSITGAGLTQSVNIRGIGLASGSPAVANGVATYIDGLFQPPIVSTNSFFDIASVEVLRGPQGTLVGSNSTGGAIFITSQNPKLNEVSGLAEVGYGNYEAAEGQVAVNIPIGDTLAVRFAGIDNYHESYYTSIGPAHTDAGELQERGGRFSALWKPGAFQALFKIEYVDRNTGGYPYRPVPGTEYAPFVLPSQSDFTLDFDTPTVNHERGQITGLELRYEFANGITLRSMSGYQDKDIHNLYDADYTVEESGTNPQLTTNQWVREREWSEEVNVISPTGGFFDWIAGSYVQRNVIDVYLLNGSTPGLETLILNPEKKITTGWFGQLNFKLTSQLQLQTGLRYSTFEEDAVGSVKLYPPESPLLPPFPGYPGPPFPAFPGPPPGLQVANLSGGYRDDRPTGKVALNYNLDDNNLVYVFAARGYKAGGFNSSTSTFGPETVWNYEAGWKATSLGGHVRTQVDAFYNQYSNFQFSVLSLSSGNTGVANLPTAQIKGFEGQIQTQFGGFQADGGFAYVDSFLPSPGPFVNTRILPSGTLGPQCAVPGQSTPPVCFNYGPYAQTGAGGPNLFSPKWTFNAGAKYRLDFAGDVSITPRLNYSYVGYQWASIAYSPVTDYIPSHGLLSTLLTLRLPEQWSIEGYGANLTNKVYVIGQSGNNNIFGAPRTYGVRVAKKF